MARRACALFDFERWLEKGGLLAPRRSSSSPRAACSSASSCRATRCCSSPASCRRRRATTCCRRCRSRRASCSSPRCVGDQVGYLFGSKVGPVAVRPPAEPAVQPGQRRQGPRVLREARLEDHRARPLRADRAHVRPDRRRGRPNEVPHVRHATTSSAASSGASASRRSATSSARSTSSRTTSRSPRRHRRHLAAAGGVRVPPSPPRQPSPEPPTRHPVRRRRNCHPTDPSSPYALPQLNLADRQSPAGATKSISARPRRPAPGAGRRRSDPVAQPRPERQRVGAERARTCPPSTDCPRGTSGHASSPMHLRSHPCPDVDERDGR